MGNKHGLILVILVILGCVARLAVGGYTISLIFYGAMILYIFLYIVFNATKKKEKPENTLK